MLKQLVNCCLLFLFAIFIACNNNKEQGTTPATKPDYIKTPEKPSGNGVPSNYSPVDISPMDMSYFPVNFPVLKISTDSAISPVMRVIYSRPHLNGRKLFKDLIKYDEPWRLGANEATEITFYINVTILGQKVQAGRYIMYCIPQEKNWEIILNSNVDTWGLKQNRAKDLYKFTVPVIDNNAYEEYFTMLFEPVDKNAELQISWDTYMATLPIQL
jgi:hypothetical protein